MKALILNGAMSPTDPANSVGATAKEELVSEGWDVDEIVLKQEQISQCRGCFGCWVKTPGSCVIDDSAKGVLAKWITADLIVLVTPITFGGYSSEIKKAVDRMIPTISPFFMKLEGEIHHRPRYRRNPRLLAIGILSQQDHTQEKIFAGLVERNAINWHSPAFEAVVIDPKADQIDINEKIRSAIRMFGGHR